MDKNRFSQIVKDKKIYIYGAGNNGVKMFHILEEQGYTIEAFMDQKATKNTSFLLGKHVLKPFPCEDSNSCVIVSIFNYHTNLEEILSFLKDLGFVSVLSYLDFTQCFYPQIGDSFWLTHTDSYPAEPKNFESIFQDQLSCETYCQIIEARKTNNVHLLPRANTNLTQYFPKDIPLNECHNFVDVGAFTGDTIESLVRRFPSLENYIAFESDLENFILLSEEANKHASELKHSILYPCALWNKNELLQFNAGEAGGSCIKENGSVMVQAVALDSILHGIPIDYIKMDIEGAEYPALIGAKKTICEQKPDLAICLYHRPEDLFRIPLLIASWNLGYSFYLRQHYYCGFDLVLYAIVQK
ncbi:MAG: FkbM family methyltransferase [Bacteroidales bacterium]